MKYILIILLIINFLNKNNGYEFKLTLYNNSNCTTDDPTKDNNIISIYSSSRCSDFGLIKDTNSEGTEGEIYYYEQLNSSNECKLALQGKPSRRALLMDTFKASSECQFSDSTLYYHQYQINKDLKPKVQIGMCNIITVFDNDCDYVKIRSFKNGSCFFENIKDYRKYYCYGDKYFTYSCGLDKTCSNCYPEIVDYSPSFYDQCTGLDVNSTEYTEYLNYFNTSNSNVSSSSELSSSSTFSSSFSSTFSSSHSQLSESSSSSTFTSSLSSTFSSSHSQSQSSESIKQNNNNDNSNNNKNTQINEDDMNGNLNNSIKIASNLSILVLFNIIYISIFLYLDF